MAATVNDQLRSIVERVERLHEERKALSCDVAEIYAEAKSNGFDVKAIRHVVAKRAKDPNELREFEAIVETYEAALGTGNATRARATLPPTKPPRQAPPTGQVEHVNTAARPFGIGDLPPELDRRQPVSA